MIHQIYSVIASHTKYELKKRDQNRYTLFQPVPLSFRPALIRAGLNPADLPPLSRLQPNVIEDLVY